VSYRQADQAVAARRVRGRVGADHELSTRVAEQHVLAWLVAQRRSAGRSSSSAITGAAATWPLP